MCEAVVTVSPNRQYLGIVRPTTPATTGPDGEWDNAADIFSFNLKLVFFLLWRRILSELLKFLCLSDLCTMLRSDFTSSLMVLPGSWSQFITHFTGRVFLTFKSYYEPDFRLSFVPEWSPMRILTFISGMCLILNAAIECRMSRDMLATSAACRVPFLLGTPDATM